jgi:hypothetical protein
MCGIFFLISLFLQKVRGWRGEMFGLHARKYFVALVWGPTRKLSQ